MAVVELWDVAVSLGARDERFEWHLDWFLGALPATDRPAELSIDVVADPFVLPAAPVGPTVVRTGPVTRWPDPDHAEVVWFVHDGGMSARLDRGAVVLDCAGCLPEDWRPTRQLLYACLSWWLDERDTLLLHGALVGRGDAAVFVVGTTGAGKSTIAAAALLHGWDVLGDDLVMVRVDAAGVQAVALPRRVTVAPELAEQLDVHVRPLPGDARGRVVLPAGVLAAGRRRVVATVVASHDDGPGVVEQVPHREALAHVTRAFLESGRDGAVRRRLRELAAIAGLPCRRLRHASDPAQRLGRAAALLDEVWTTTGVDQ